MWPVHRTLYFRTQKNQLNRRVRAAIKDFRNKRWNTFFESLSTEDNTIGKAANRIRNTLIHIPSISSVNGLEYTNTEKGDNLA